MNIAFIHPHRAFLPEVEAYTAFFAEHGIQTTYWHPDECSRIKADLEWYFMGMARHRKKNTVTIHEYTSASLPPFRKWKDRLKRKMNVKPDYRLFLNEYVKQQFGFNDGIPCGYRDMGVPKSVPRQESSPAKEYDFIYTGSTDKKRNLEPLLQRFTRSDFKEHSLLILSRNYVRLAEQFRNFDNIRFMGPVVHEAVNTYIAKARFAINYLPDEEPFNQQTSTKLLEYAALQIPVISSDYAWVRKFQQKHGGHFFYLEKDLSNFSWENIVRYRYSFPDLKEWTWERQIRHSGVLDFLASRNLINLRDFE